MARRFFLNASATGKTRLLSEGLTQKCISPPLGYKALNPEDVIDWLEQKQTGAFCLCPSGCWADLIFALKMDGEYLWVALRTFHSKDVQEESESLTRPDLFCLALDTYQARLSNALTTLPNIITLAGGSFPLLRVVASFPEEPVLSIDFEKNLVGPIGVLKVETFNTITEAFSPNFLIETLSLRVKKEQADLCDIHLCQDNLFGSQEEMEMTY
ncbi:hypothetical protein H0H93_014412 [Arthromyces matolae]|nr:hypothetical protein H0H93_014412 [Arthromyces matolae]